MEIIEFVDFCGIRSLFVIWHVGSCEQSSGSKGPPAPNTPHISSTLGFVGFVTSASKYDQSDRQPHSADLE